MKEKTINEWHDTDSIDWNIYWKHINALDGIIKKYRNPKSRSRGGWQWPESNYNAPTLFRERFHADGKVNKSYKTILQNIDSLVKYDEKFISGIIQSMLRRMEHPLRRRQWDKNTKTYLSPKN